MNVMRKLFLRPVSMCMIVIVCLVYGIYCAMGMPLELLPDMTMPMLCVSCVYPGAGAASVKDDVTDALEAEIKTISKIDSLDSYSMDNVSLVVISFDYGVSLEKKSKEVEDLLDNITLPDQCNAPSVLMINFNGSAIASVSVSADNIFTAYSDAQMLRDRFLAIEDVGNVNIDGYTERGIRITPINGLESITLLLVQAVAYDNSLDIPIGSITEGNDVVALRNDSSARAIDDLRNIPIELPLPDETVELFLKLSDIIDYYNSLNSNDMRELKTSLDSVCSTINTFEDMSASQVQELIDSAEQLKTFIEFFEGHTAKELEALWRVLQPICESEQFLSLTHEELLQLSNELAEYGYDIDVSVLHWVQDNSLPDEETGVSPIELKWEKLISFRKEHGKKSASNEDYAALLYDLGFIQCENKNADNYVEEEQAVFIVNLARNNGIPTLRSIKSSKKAKERVSDSTYAKLLSYATNDIKKDELTQIVTFVRADSYEESWELLYETKLQNEDYCLFRDFDSDGKMLTEWGLHSRALSPYAVYSLYETIDLGEDKKLSYTATPELFSFILGIERDSVVNNNNGSSSVFSTLGDVATVCVSHTSNSYAMLNDDKCVTVNVYGISDANTTKVSAGVISVLDSYSGSIASEAKLTNDRSTFISDSVDNVLSSMLIGGLLAVMVIFVFLRQFRSSLIISITMPLSVVCALIALDIMGTTLNMVSLGGLTVGIGMLVDNSIVVIDSISQERALGKNAIDSAVDGTRQVVGSLIASTLTSICVFFPILFTQGLTKEIFSDLAYAVLFSLTFSLIVALLVIPTLYCMLYKKQDDKKAKDEGFIMKKIATLYEWLLRRALRHRLLVALLALVIFAASIIPMLGAGIEFMPSVDKGIVQATMSFPTNAALEDCYATTKAFYQSVRDNIEGIDYIQMSVGKQGIAATANTGIVELHLLQAGETTKAVVERVRALSENYGVSTSVVRIDGIVAEITSGMSGLSVRVLGDDVEVLREISATVKETLAKNDSFKHVYDNLTDESVQYLIAIDEKKCARLGVDYSTLISTLRAGVSGYEVCAAEIDGERMKITVSFGENALDEYYGGFFDYTIGYDSEGNAIAISDVSTINKESTRSVIRTYNGINQLDISAEIFGTDTGSALSVMNAAVEDALEGRDGYTFGASGVASYLSSAFIGLVYSLAISFLLLFAVMAGQFESLIYPIIVLFAIPLSFTGGFLALIISGAALSVVSFVGFIMLMGVVVNNAIIMIDRIMQLHSDGMPHLEAVIAGCKSRLRAVFMTTLTTVLALVPLALGIGEGAGLMQPLGIVVIGGLTVGTLVTLMLIPVMYSFIRRVDVGTKKKSGKSKSNKSLSTQEVI